MREGCHCVWYTDSQTEEIEVREVTFHDVDAFQVRWWPFVVSNGWQAIPLVQSWNHCVLSIYCPLPNVTYKEAEINCTQTLRLSGSSCVLCTWAWWHMITWQLDALVTVVSQFPLPFAHCTLQLLTSFSTGTRRSHDKCHQTHVRLGHFTATIIQWSQCPVGIYANGAENLTGVCGFVSNGNVWRSNHFGPMAMWVLNAMDQWAFSGPDGCSHGDTAESAVTLPCVPSPSCVVSAVGMFVLHGQCNACVPTYVRTYRQI